MVGAVGGGGEPYGCHGGDCGWWSRYSDGGASREVECYRIGVRWCVSDGFRRWGDLVLRGRYIGVRRFDRIGLVHEGVHVLDHLLARSTYLGHLIVLLIRTDTREAREGAIVELAHLLA